VVYCNSWTLDPNRQMTQTCHLFALFVYSLASTRIYIENLSSSFGRHPCHSCSKPANRQPRTFPNRHAGRHMQAQLTQIGMYRACFPLSITHQISHRSSNFQPTNKPLFPSQRPSKQSQDTPISCHHAEPNWRPSRFFFIRLSLYDVQL
jgi:hypothetical protein